MDGIHLGGDQIECCCGSVLRADRTVAIHVGKGIDIHDERNLVHCERIYGAVELRIWLGAPSTAVDLYLQGTAHVAGWRHAPQPLRASLTKACAVFETQNTTLLKVERHQR